MLKLQEPPRRPLIAGSILSADFTRLGEECHDVIAHGIDLIHLDVMDGHFVPNLTMGPVVCQALRDRFPSAFLDVHLMTNRPADWIEPFAEAGANLLTFHIERCSPCLTGGEDPRALIDRIHHHDVAAGLAVNPETNVTTLQPWLGSIDLALIMSVHPGYAGQKFMPAVLDKTRWLSQVVGRRTRVEIDGGVKPHNAGDCVAAGVDVMVIASGLFHAADRGAVIEQLHQAGHPPAARGPH